MRSTVQRFSSDFTGSVKYSTSCPSRRDSPCAARRAMPMSFGLSDSGSRGREAIGHNHCFVFCSPRVRLPGPAVKGRSGGGNWTYVPCAISGVVPIRSRREQSAFVEHSSPGAPHNVVFVVWADGKLLCRVLRLERRGREPLEGSVKGVVVLGGARTPLASPERLRTKALEVSH